MVSLVVMSHYGLPYSDAPGQHTVGGLELPHMGTNR